MKRRLLFIFFLFCFPLAEYGQTYTWIQKATYGGAARHRAVGVSVGGRGYMGLGHINSVVDVQFADWWEYDPGTNSWAQKANFPPGKRYHAVAFAIDSFAYVGTGRDTTFNNRRDFW